IRNSRKRHLEHRHMHRSVVRKAVPEPDEPKQLRTSFGYHHLMTMAESPSRRGTDLAGQPQQVAANPNRRESPEQHLFRYLFPAKEDQANQYSSQWPKLADSYYPKKAESH